MGDINGGPGSGGYGQQWNPYGRGPQQPRAFELPMSWPPPQPFAGSGGYGGGSWAGAAPAGGGWAGGVNPWGTVKDAPRYVPREADSVAGPPPPAPGGYQPGSFSAGVAALNRGSPYAQDMLRQAAGLPSQIGTSSSQGPGQNPALAGNTLAGTLGQGPAPRSGQGFTPQFQGSYAPMMGPDGRMHDTTPGSMAGSWTPQPFGGQQQFTPNQQLMMQSGRGQRGFWQGPTSPYGMQGPWGSAGPGYRQSLSTPSGGMQNGAPK